MKKIDWFVAVVCVLLLTSVGMAQCNCGPGCKCPPSNCPDCCTLKFKDAQGRERVSYCFTANLFGALISTPPAPRYFIYTPPVGADPQMLMALQRIQDQQSDVKAQMALDRQSQEMWRHQQAQLQILQAQNQTFMAALQSGNANTTETRQLMSQIIVNQQAVLNAIQNQQAPPTIVTPGITPAITPAATPPAMQPEATKPSTSYSTRRTYSRPRSPLEIILGVR